MPPIHYRVSQPGMVTEALRIILSRAKFENRLPLVLKAARFLFDELAYDPLHFGESRQTAMWNARMAEADFRRIARRNEVPMRLGTCIANSAQRRDAHDTKIF